MTLWECPVCGTKIHGTDTDNQDMLDITCPVCGRYRIEADVVEDENIATHPNRYILSAVLRRRTEDGFEKVAVLRENVRDLLDEVNKPPGLWQRLDMFLLEVFKRTPRLGAGVAMFDNDYPLVFAQDSGELWYMRQALIQMGYLERAGDAKCLLSPKGWHRVDELRAVALNRGRRCFVAMSFSPELNDAYLSGIEPGIRDGGYDPIRVDGEQFNGKICDRIVADIRESRLLVADFTYHRGGVYFEAGFAMGLGIPVIWTCRQDDIGNAHFDTRQYNHIVWQTPADLRTKLKERIQATVPLGTIGPK